MITDEERAFNIEQAMKSRRDKSAEIRKTEAECKRKHWRWYKKEGIRKIL